MLFRSVNRYCTITVMGYGDTGRDAQLGESRVSLLATDIMSEASMVVSDRGLRVSSRSVTFLYSVTSAGTSSSMGYLGIQGLT